MSFVKMPPKPRNGTVKVGDKKKKKKPEWDSTQNDLSVYKASPEEIVRRKLVHQSQNAEAVQLEKLRKKIARARIHARSPNSAKKRQMLHKQRQNALLREMLFDQSQLHDTLEKSDRAMAVVKDLFGDDPKKYRGLPNVTTAPNEKASTRPLPDGSSIEQPTQLDLLSNSVMNKSALNDLGTDSDEYEDDEDESYKPVIDFERFQRFLQETEETNTDELDTAKLADRVAARLAKERMADLLTSKVHSGGDVQKQAAQNMNGSYLEDQHTPQRLPVCEAINATDKVEKTSSRLEPEETRVSTASHADLKQVLVGLEANIADYERQTGRQPTVNVGPPSNFSGYTLSLVNAVSKLTAYLKESERRLSIETTLREQLGQDVQQLRATIDGLNVDVITTQEEYIKLVTEFNRYRKETQQQLAMIMQSLAGHNMVVPTGQLLQQSVKTQDSAAEQQSHVQPVPSALLPQQTVTQSMTIPQHSQPQQHDQRLLMQLYQQQQQLQQQQQQIKQHQQQQLQSEILYQQQPIEPKLKHQQQTTSQQSVAKSLQSHAPSGSVNASVGQLPVRPAFMLSPPQQTDSPKTSGSLNQGTVSRIHVNGLDDENTEVPDKLSINPSQAGLLLNQNLRPNGQMIPPHQSAFRPPQSDSAAVMSGAPAASDDRSAIQLQFEKMEEEKREVEKKLRQLRLMEEQATRHEEQVMSGATMTAVSPSISPIPDSSDVGAPRYGIPPAPGPPVLTWSRPAQPLNVQPRASERSAATREIKVAMPKLPLSLDVTPPGAPPYLIQSARSSSAS